MAVLQEMFHQGQISKSIYRLFRICVILSLYLCLDIITGMYLNNVKYETNLGIYYSWWTRTSQNLRICLNLFFISNYFILPEFSSQPIYIIPPLYFIYSSVNLSTAQHIQQINYIYPPSASNLPRGARESQEFNCFLH